MSKTVIIQAQQKWDYCFESRRTDNALLIALTDLGQHGWELVNVFHHKDPKGETLWTAFLKRPSAGQAAASGQTTANQAKTAPSSPSAEKQPQPQGFDLSGDEFQVRGE